MNSQPIVVGMGEALWDVLPEGKKLGGAPANFAYHVSQFGLNSRVVSAVGQDKLGTEILDSFRQKQLYGMVETVPYPTGTVQVELDAEGVPCYDIKEGVAWDNIPYTQALEGLARQTRAVCFGSLAQRSIVSRETIHRFLDAMPDDADTLKIFDINLRQSFYTKEILCESFRRCNILKPAGQVLDSAGQVRPEDAHPDLRRQRQLRLHARSHLVCRDTEGAGCRHRGGRRLVYRLLRGRHAQGAFRGRCPSAGRRHIGLRLHAAGRHARTARVADQPPGLTSGTAYPPFTGSLHGSRTTQARSASRACMEQT